MRLDEDAVYSMPLIMGPLFDRVGRPGRAYGRVETLSATFRTEPEAVRPLVPDCFLIPDEPTITVGFGDYDHVDFLAGGGYRVAYAGVSARFVGEESYDGLHILVMWENETVPIVTRRDLIGIPKFYADITPLRPVSEGAVRATAAVWGHEVMRLEAAGFKEQNMVARRIAQKRVNQTPWLGYKHVP
jgi:acetoacetate decarboxylase